MNINKPLIIVMVILITCAGCTSHHYTTVDNRSVSFYLRLPDAEHVQFSSSMDKYQLHEAEKNVRGLWEVTLPVHGETNYFYIVDGALYIPDCLWTQTDDFGSKNCLFTP